MVVRTKNEEKTVGKLFDILKKQTFKKFETVVVDNESTDKTLEVVERFSPDKIISIADTSFTHGYSLNRGIENSKGRLIILTNGHCVPISTTWLEDGIKNFSNTKIAAIDGYYIDIRSKSNEPTLKERVSGGQGEKTNRFPQQMQS